MFYPVFLRLKKNTEVEKIFESISKFSEKSEVRYVGGCIRKILNQEEVDDIDLAANIEPKQVIEILKKNKIDFYETGIEHGTITAKIKNKKFEITSLRKDVSTDGRHARVEFSDNWHEDASRRDFTFNSIYADTNGNLYDPFNGKKDLKIGEVKFIGDANKRIKEDYLRILRYVRFFLNYSKIKHNSEIKKIIRQNLNGLSKISSDRLLDELRKLVLSNGFLKLPKDSFCLEIINLVFPQLKNLYLFKNLNKYVKKNIGDQDFIFLISLMIIDETDNSEYFLYKFNISNEDKKRIRFLSNIFSKLLDKNTFSEKNLWKILYYNNNNFLNDLINFQMYRSKKIGKKLLELKEFFNNQIPPKFNVKAKSLMDKFNLKEGKELGQKLKEIELVWINNSFKVTEKQIEKIVKS
ncbi:MAG: CCA tRNA nucleotidyltransferase [Candidatus Pelagibacter bacterium]|nr:CCA tRNA nucleotidyltransferase [Candidatus Pelagibacter bacterium]